MLDAAYRAWHTDVAAGRASVMIAPTRDTVIALNTRARNDRIAAGDVATSGAVALHDDTQASVGDVVVTRRNDRRLIAGKHWVRNGDRWTLTANHPDGSVTVRGPHGRVQLPAAYVAENLELGYATTIHRTQGRTVDTAHAIVQPGMTREALYVALTRGRHANTAYVTADSDTRGRAVLTGILARVGAEPSAHEAIRQEHERSASIAQLAAE